MPNDPFAVLGLNSSATEDEIKSAYRKLAKKYHPDLNPGDKAAEEKMREVNEAYTRALQIKKTGKDPYQNPYGSSGSSSFGSSAGFGSSCFGSSFLPHAASENTIASTSKSAKRRFTFFIGVYLRFLLSFF